MKIVRSVIDFLPRRNRVPPRHFWPETNSASRRRHSRISNLQSRFTSFGLRKFRNISSGLRSASGEIFIGIHSWLSQLFRFDPRYLVVILPRASFLFRRRKTFLIVRRCAPKIFEGAACTPLIHSFINSFIHHLSYLVDLSWSFSSFEFLDSSSFHTSSFVKFIQLFTFSTFQPFNLS
jgi:hypothetical protein